MLWVLERTLPKVIRLNANSVKGNRVLVLPGSGIRISGGRAAMLAAVPVFPTKRIWQTMLRPLGYRR